MRFGGSISCWVRRLGQPLEVAARVVVEVVAARRAAAALLDLLVRRGGHVEQEGDGDVALDLVAAPVDLRHVAVAGALLDHEVDGGVEVDVLAVFELLDLAEGLRLAAARTGAASR